MAPRPLSLLAVVLLASVLHLARSDDASSDLLKGINNYRASLKVPALTGNDNAECLAEKLAEQFKGQPCSNTTGSSTVPGNEQQFPNFPDFLNSCHLNATVTQDGAIMPACVPNLDKDIVLSNFTKTQYNEYLNSSDYVGAGIADEGDWVVVVLTKNTTTGSFASVTGSSAAPKVGFLYHLLPLLMVAIMVLVN